MATITVSATVGTTYYQTTASWHNTSESAYQGSYNNGTSRVGVMVFSGLGTTLKGKRINSITFEPTIYGGSGDASRTITFWSSNYQSISSSVAGGSYPKSQMGTLVGDGTVGTGTASTYSGKQKFTLNSSTNSSLFTAWAARLVAGDTTFVLYNGESSKASGYSYSANYLSFTAVSMTIDYDNVYTVTYNANGHGTAPSAQSVTIGSSITLPTMTATGYSFLGWSTSSTATSGMTGTYTPTASVTLYAVWGTGGYVYYNDGGTAVKCEDYYNDAGSAVRCDIYYNDAGTAVKM